MTNVAHNLDSSIQNMPGFVSSAPKITLVNAFQDSFNNAIATARTCYSSKVITASDVAASDQSLKQRDAIAKSTYAAGHHTTLQHATFQFVLENVSRQFIWSFLHAHPFYNSEQVSQRYVTVKPNRVVIPELPQRLQSLYEETITSQMTCYQQLINVLASDVQQEYLRIFPARGKNSLDHVGAVKKKCQEIARYVLPIATFAHLYHTISGLTLHRYHRLANMLDVSHETRFVVTAMVGAVNQVDPLFFKSIEDALPLEETHEYLTLKNLGRLSVSEHAKNFRKLFDEQLAGNVSQLVDYSVRAETTLAHSVRTVLGTTPEELSDRDAIDLVLSPAKNPYLAQQLTLTSLGKLTRTMTHVHYSFQKKLSHTADSQDQRHRLTPGARPILHTQYVGGEPDVIVPVLIQKNQQALDIYWQTLRATWNTIDTLLDAGVNAEQALYLLPNAFPIRFIESGDLTGFHHKWTTRLCYNAQEEIWQASCDEVQQVQNVHPGIGKYLAPPCKLRLWSQEKPYCPEGTHYCGVPVWKLELEQFERLI